MTRTQRTTLTADQPFDLASIGRRLPAGVYEVISDEELIESLSFPVYRRVASWIMVPSETGKALEMVSLDGEELRSIGRRSSAVDRSDGSAGDDDARPHTGTNGVVRT